MLKDNRNSREYSKDNMVEFLDISNVSKSPLEDIKDLKHLEKIHGINSAVDLENRGVTESKDETIKRNLIEKFVLVDLGVEGFIKKYLGF